MLSTLLSASRGQPQSIVSAIRCGTEVFRCSDRSAVDTGALVGLLAAAPATLWTELEGALRSVLAQDKVTFALQSMNPNPLPGGTGDPIAHSDIESWLGTWTGPIVQKDSRPYSVELELVHDGTTVVGLVSYPDPN